MLDNLQALIVPRVNPFKKITHYYCECPNGDIRRGSGEPGIVRNAYGLLGSEQLAAGEAGLRGASPLVELTGLNSRGKKSAGLLRNNIGEMLEAVLWRPPTVA